MLLEVLGYKARPAYSAEHAITKAKNLQPHALISELLA